LTDDPSLRHRALTRGAVLRVGSGGALAALNAAYFAAKFGTITLNPAPLVYGTYLVAFGLIAWGIAIWRRAERLKRAHIAGS
jgi:xanthine/uracil permease